MPLAIFLISVKKQNMPESVWSTQNGFVIVAFKRSKDMVGISHDLSTTLVRPKYDPSSYLINAMTDDF